MWAYKLTLITAVAAASPALRTGSLPSMTAKLEPGLAAKFVEVQALSIEGKKAMRELLHDFMEEVDTDLGVKEFMPKCLAHVKKLVHTMDVTYTDQQLKTLLTNECQLSKEFPHSSPSQFQSHKACLKFADQLSDARMLELKTNKTDQYTKFCKDYAKHAAPKAATPKAGTMINKAASKAGTAIAKATTAATKGKKVEKIVDKKPEKSAASQMLAGFTVALAVANAALAW